MHSTACACIAVSYTHLDVYKRQEIFTQIRLFGRGVQVHILPTLFNIYVDDVVGIRKVQHIFFVGLYTSSRIHI